MGDGARSTPPLPDVARSAVARVVAEYGRDVAAKLRDPAGEREDQLRAPTERLIARMGDLLGLSIVSFGETRIPELAIRPDYAVSVAHGRVGYVELKAPGKRVPTFWRPTGNRDWKQWEKLALLPNVLYTDGLEWALYRSGQLQGSVSRLGPDFRTAQSLTVDNTFARVITDFLLWKPERPRTLGELVNATGRLCRLLRQEVEENLHKSYRTTGRGEHFAGLRDDWRRLLFPGLTDDTFADAYAQTVTFALLLARVEGIELDSQPIGQIATQLGKKHSVMGKALQALVEESIESSSVVVDTMLRVIGAVDWEVFDDDAYVYLYERFLASYDPALRKHSGSYYTPRPVVEFMTRFTEDVIRRRLGIRRGFADDRVVIVDPAMGTGSFLAEAMKRAAETIVAEDGEGRRGPGLRAMSERLIGFEQQAAPFAIAELRVHQAFTVDHQTDIPAREARFLTDALGQPGIDELDRGLGSLYRVLQKARWDADRIKREVPVMAVIANPPYRNRAKGEAQWIEARNESSTPLGVGLQGRPNLDAFRSPGNGKFEYVLSNQYVYFWRWATWKAFDAHSTMPYGVVTLISPRAFLDGSGFAGMREYLRRTADEGWIVDLSPEQHQSRISSRVFPENQNPLCIAVFVRHGYGNAKEPASVYHTSVSGSREEKFLALGSLEVDDGSWAECLRGWTDPLAPSGSLDWLAYPALGEILPWQAPGVKPNRTWVYAPEVETLRKRWSCLVDSEESEKAALFKETSASNLTRIVRPLHGYEAKPYSFQRETGDCPTPRRVAFRAFDRQWVLPDARLHHRPSPDLWRVASDDQIFLTEQHTHPIADGLAIMSACDIPDMHHFNGRGGRVLPLYRETAALQPNIAPGLISLIQRRLRADIKPEDFLAYIVGVVGHRGFTARFIKELTTHPGVRVPLTANPELFWEAAALGREVVWLQTFGERFVDEKAGRPQGGIRAASYVGMPRNEEAVSDSIAAFPDEIRYEKEIETVWVGSGQFRPVSLPVWNYTVGGMKVLRHWFGYRRRNPSGRGGSKLTEIRAERWADPMTGELLNLLTVLDRCVRIEPSQDQVLDKILGSELLTVGDLGSAGVLPAPSWAMKPARGSTDPSLLPNFPS